MSLLLLLRSWLGSGEPPAPGQMYRLRGTVARVAGLAATARVVGGATGRASRAVTVAGSITHV